MDAIWVIVIGYYLSGNVKPTIIDTVGFTSESICILVQPLLADFLNEILEKNAGIVEEGKFRISECTAASKLLGQGV